MNSWLIDSYRAQGKVVLWLKNKDGNVREEHDFDSFIYLEKSTFKFLKRYDIPHKLVAKKNYLGQEIAVFEIKIPNISEYEKFIGWIEKETRHRVMLYNADLPPEQEYLYKNNLRPGLSIDGTDDDISLSKCHIGFEQDSLMFDDRMFRGENRYLEFLDAFNALDPDVILMDHAFSKLPLLEADLLKAGLESPFHRWDKTPITYKGGKTFFSYGNVIYRDYAIRLKGRLLIDTSSVVGNDCDIEGILELCRLTGARFQQIASRSYGAIFQHALVRSMYEKNYLIPYKEKPVDQPMSMLDMLRSDNAGHRFDAKVGYHEDVAEIDFSSMFPWIIYNYNISAETILRNDGSSTKVPGLPISISQYPKGIVPLVIKPLLDRRMEYKKNPTSINKERIKALKYVLVTAYGYLRFREFKLGIATSHMAICAYARDILIKSAKLAEERGFTVVHGVVDSLFLKKRSISDEDIRLFCKDLEALFNIPVSYEGIFKWIIFLPSVNNIYRPLPSSYYGIFRNGSIKSRGIEARQRKIPLLVKIFQQKIIEDMALLDSRKEIIKKIPEYCAGIRRILKNAHKIPKEQLAYTVRISKTDYKVNNPQSTIVKKYAARGIRLYPGQLIQYIHQQNKIVLPEEYNGKPSKEHYQKLLIRSLFNIVQPLGIAREQITEWSNIEKQTKLTDYTTIIRQVGLPFDGALPRLRLSEKVIRKRFEKQGYLVWRGGSMTILDKEEIYPNVRKKYELLYSLLERYHPGRLDDLKYLCDIHHGMPDFLIYKDGKFKFVECKLGYEQLSAGQKKCISKLQDLGFEVELYKLIEPQTKTVLAEYNVHSGQKIILESQEKIEGY